MQWITAHTEINKEMIGYTYTPKKFYTNYTEMDERDPNLWQNIFPKRKCDIDLLQTTTFRTFKQIKDLIKNANLSKQNQKLLKQLIDYPVDPKETGYIYFERILNTID